MQNRQLIFSPKKPYDLVAERSEASPVDLTFPVWWTILKLARMFFAPRFARGDGEAQKI